MPLYKLTFTSKTNRLLPLVDIRDVCERLIMMAGNKKYATTVDVVVNDLYVSCDKKPLDSLEYGITWEEKLYDRIK
jgi:hypothetical protein